MEMKIDSRVLDKLQNKHNVSSDEVYEAFGNVTKGFLEDSREQHTTYTKTYWFIAETDMGRLLKIVFIRPNSEVIIKTAYEPSEKVIQLYLKSTRK
jgi:hypothetical protein